MKTINLFGKELKFNNNELSKAADIAINEGYKVYTFNPSGYYIKQIFVANDKTFGSVSTYFSGVRYSTCHVSERDSGNGTGFGMSEDIELASAEGLLKCFVFAPRWATKTDKIKKQTWEQYKASKMGSILEYAEITTLKKYSVSFIGRLKGAIGVRYEIKDIVTLSKTATEKEIYLSLYDKYEHISKLRINGKLYSYES